MLLLLGPFVSVLLLLVSFVVEAVSPAAAVVAGRGIHVKTLRFDAAAAPWCESRHVMASAVAVVVVVVVMVKLDKLRSNSNKWMPSLVKLISTVPKESEKWNTALLNPDTIIKTPRGTY